VTRDAEGVAGGAVAGKVEGWFAVGVAEYGIGGGFGEEGEDGGGGVGACG